MGNIEWAPDFVDRNATGQRVLELMLYNEYAVFRTYPENYLPGDQNFVEFLIQLYRCILGACDWCLLDNNEIEEKVRTLSQKDLYGKRIIKILDFVSGDYVELQVVIEARKSFHE